ncbi:MAG: T9SS type A sorting domain-containing protein [Flavobacteriales bacterium]|jgi:hypothetical protein|nr:T9SS type A sorting domain-containing protein [Flavobacteriales bacterium]
MIKKLRMLAAFATVFAVNQGFSQSLTCTETATQSGQDASNYITSVYSPSCADTATNGWITEVEVQSVITYGSGSSVYCPSWYNFDIIVNGQTILDGTCDQSVMLSDHGIDLNNIDSIQVKIHNTDPVSDATVTNLTVDYTYIQTTCPPPNELDATTIGTTTATIDFNENGTALLWEYELVNVEAGDTATGTPTNTIIGNSEVSLTSLTPDNDYAIYVRAMCSPDSSMWAGPLNFTTDPTCLPVSNVTIQNITDVSAVAEWISAEDAWEIELINTSASGTFTGNPTVTSITDSTYTFTSLLPETDYSFKVRANCGVVDGNGAWSAAVSFTTDPSCLPPSGLTDTLLTASGITLSWTANDGETEWGIELVNLDNGETQEFEDDYIATTNPTITLTGLAASTDYAVYVNAQCSGTDSSTWIGPLNFQTLCVPFSMPYVDSIDNFAPDCFEIGPMVSGDQWNHYTSNGKSMRAPTRYMTSTQTPIWFTTAEVNYSTGGYLHFDVANTKYSGTANTSLKIEYSTNGGSTWTNLWLQENEDLSTSTSSSFTNAVNPHVWEEKLVLLPTTLVGQTLKFRFTAGKTSGGTYTGANMFVDNIGVRSFSTCEPAFSLTFDSATLTTANFSFIDVADQSQSFYYEAISADLTDTVTGTATASPFTVTGLMSSTSYNMSLTTYCTSDTVNGPSVSFNTDCGIFTSFTENFDNANGADMPNCWGSILANVPASSNASIKITQYSAKSGSYKMDFDHGSQSSSLIPDMILYSPELDSLSDKWMTFWLRGSYNSSSHVRKIEVGYITDITDEDSFVELETITVTGSSYTKYDFKPSDYPNFQGTRIAFRYDWNSSYGVDVYMDDVIWEIAPTCYPPTNVVVDSANANTVFGSFTPADTADTEWFAEIVNLTAGQSVTGVATDTITSTNFAISGLNPNSQYEIYFLTNCGIVQSDWMLNGVDFTTACTAQDSLDEGFENGAPCWSFIANAPSGFVTSAIYNGYAQSSSKSVRLYHSSSANNEEVLAITPELSNMNSGDRKLVFNYRRAYGPVGTLQLGTMTDNTDPATFTELATYPSTSTSYQEVEYGFANYTGTDKYIAFRLKENGTYNYIHIDNVSWEEMDSCATPVNLNVTNLTDVSATLNASSLSLNSQFDFEWINITAGDTFTYTPDTTVLTGATVDITGLLPSTTYEFIVRNTCDSTWTFAETFTTPASYDVVLDGVISPDDNGCMLTASEEVIIGISNNGGQPAFGFDVYYSWDDTTYMLDSTYPDTIASGQSAIYTLTNTFDFSSAQDSTIYIKLVQTNDADTNNNVDNQDITNQGNALVQIVINTGNYAGEYWWNIIDTAAGNTVFNVAQPNGYSNYTDGYTYDVCLFEGVVYSFEAWDDYGDGWNSGTYEVSQCFGNIIINNNGESPDDPTVVPPGTDQLEALEYFSINACPDNDLAIISFDSVSSACGLSASEIGYVSFKNHGNDTVTSASGASIQYSVNGSPMTDVYTFTTPLAPGATAMAALPSVDMSTAGNYTYSFQVLFPADSSAQNNTLTATVVSIPQDTASNNNFDVTQEGWTSGIIQGITNSWEWGVPTTANMAQGTQGKAWVTKLDTNAALNEDSYLLSPCYDFSGYTADVEISMDYIMTTPVSGFSSHYARLQYTTDDNSWTTVDMQPNNFSNNFATSNTWTDAGALITGLAGEPYVRFRFYFRTSFSNPIEGFGVDNIEIKEHVPYTDATLSNLTYNGITVPGFHPDTLNYTVMLPFGTTNIPNVSAVYNAPIVDDIDVDQAPALPGAATVEVTAEDTAFSLLYTVNFEVTPGDTNAYLSDLSYGGNTIAGFDSTITQYTITVPYGTTNFGAFTGTASSNLSNTLIGQLAPGTTLPDTIYANVTAQDPNYTMQYMVIVNEEAPNANAFLSDIQVNGNSVIGFDSTTYNYTYTVPNGATATVLPHLANSLASYTMTPSGTITTFPTTVSIVVTAQDTNVTNTYTVVINEVASDNAFLSDLLVDGTTITGFDSSVYTYNYDTLAYGASIPPITWVTSDPDVDTAYVTIANNTATVTVLAENMTTQKEYFINFFFEDGNTNALLSGITGSFGRLIDAGSNNVTATFDPNTFLYEWCIDKVVNINSIPTLTPTAQEATSTINFVQNFAAIGDTAIIEVTAQDTNYTETYKIILKDCTTGLEDLEEGKVTVYPNPTNGIVNIDVESSITDFEITVYNPLGQIVKQDAYQDQTSVEYDLSEMTNGLYQVVLRDKLTNKVMRTKINVLK